MPSEVIDKEKTIMGYKMNFKTSYDETDAEGEYIVLTVNVSDELKGLLKNATIRTLCDVNLVLDSNSSETIKVKRYKIKSLINNRLSQHSRDIMFMKDLIDNGTVSLKFKSVDLVIHHIDSLKSNFRTLIETVVGCLNISQEVTFNVVNESR